MLVLSQAKILISSELSSIDLCYLNNNCNDPLLCDALDDISSEYE